MRIFFSLVLFLSVFGTLSMAMDDKAFSFKDFHEALLFSPDTHELTIQRTLYRTNTALVKEVQPLVSKDSVAVLTSILLEKEKLRKDRKNFFCQMNDAEQAKALGYDWEELWKKQETYLLDENKDKIFGIASNILAENIHALNSAHPLGFLDECLGDGFVANVCSLCRIKHPIHRHKFEDLLVENLLEQVPSNNGYLMLAELGSGDLFQTVVVLEKLLAGAQSKIKKIDLHLIDPQYKIEISKGMRTFEEEKKKYMKEVYNITCSNRQRMAFYQFMSWFRDIHPELEFKLFIYESLDDYVAINKINKLDCLWAVDLDLGYFSSIETQGMATFIKAPFDEILKEEASAFSLMSNDQSIIQVLPLGYIISKQKIIELSVEEIAQIKFESSDVSDRLKSKSKRNTIRIPRAQSDNQKCNLL
jgi:hypothetical protein